MLLRVPSFSRTFIHFSIFLLCCYMFWDASGCPRRIRSFPLVLFAWRYYGHCWLPTDRLLRSAFLINWSQVKARSFHTEQAESTMHTLDRVSGVSIRSFLTSCALAFYSVLVHPVCVSAPASSSPHLTVMQLPLAIWFRPVSGSLGTLSSCVMPDVPYC